MTGGGDDTSHQQPPEPAPLLERLTALNLARVTLERLLAGQADLAEVEAVIELLEPYGRQGYGIDPLIHQLEEAAIHHLHLDPEQVQVEWTLDLDTGTVIVDRADGRIVLRAGPATSATQVRQAAEQTLNRWELAVFARARHTHSNGITHRHPDTDHLALEEEATQATGAEPGHPDFVAYIEQRLPAHTGISPP